MEIKKTSTGENVLNVKVALGKEDFHDKYINELKKHRQKSQLKGFRKGKTPMSMIKKMYGAQTLANTVFDKVNEVLDDYIKTEELGILGQPLPADDQEQYDFSGTQDSYTFSFDLGLEPTFEIVGLDDTYDVYKVEIPDSEIDDMLENIAKQHGVQEEVDDKVTEGDIVSVEAEEMDGKKVKENGWATEFSLYVNDITDEKVKKKVLGAEKGTSFDFDITSLEGEKSEEYVNKYLLNRGEDTETEIGNNFRGKIAVIKRLKPAELTEEVFQKHFQNEEVKDEEAARKYLREDLQGYFDNQARLLMNRKVMESMMDKTQIDLPDNFMKKWLEASSEENTSEKIEENYEGFKENLKWTLIKNKLGQKHEVKVEPGEIRESAVAKILNYMRGYPIEPAMMDKMVDNLLQDREQLNRIYDEIQANKVFEAIEKDLSLKDKKISPDDFKEEVKKVNEALSANQPS